MRILWILRSGIEVFVLNQGPQLLFFLTFRLKLNELIEFLEMEFVLKSFEFG